MMEWYTPLTILPAIGLIILSTSNFLVALNNELTLLEKESGFEWVIDQKLKQLKRLGIANALLYLSAFLFVISALSMAFYESVWVFQLLMIMATVFMTLALAFLLVHSLKSIQIRQKHLKQ